MAAETIKYEGEIYSRRNGQWVDSLGTIVCENLQKNINRQFAEKLDSGNMSLEECIAEGDNFKNSTSFGLALKFYEAAVVKADRVTLSYILPRITSCYRKTGQAQKAIKVLTHASERFGGNMITPALLTSAAAAYCDLRDYKRAKKCCDRAYAASNGNSTDEISLVYKRIRKESGQDF